MATKIKYISVGKAARRIGVSVGYLHKLCKERKIHHARVGELKRDALGRDMRPIVIAEYEIENLLDVKEIKRN